jgi:hypothetical protein
MSQYIYDLQNDKLTKNEGIFKRFSNPCIGKQVTLKDIKDVKSHMFEKLKNKKGTREYDEWFLNYNPIEKHKKNKALKGKAAEIFKEKIASINKHSPSYSKRKNTPVTASPSLRTPKMSPRASPRRFTRSKRLHMHSTPNKNKKNVKTATHTVRRQKRNNRRN